MYHDIPSLSSFTVSLPGVCMSTALTECCTSRFGGNRTPSFSTSSLAGFSLVTVTFLTSLGCLFRLAMEIGEMDWGSSWVTLTAVLTGERGPSVPTSSGWVLTSGGLHSK